jgi:hypothetical protein
MVGVTTHTDGGTATTDTGIIGMAAGAITEIADTKPRVPEFQHFAALVSEISALRGVGQRTVHGVQRRLSISKHGRVMVGLALSLLLTTSLAAQQPNQTKAGGWPAGHPAASA